jgi:hypothetical protein
MGVINKFFGRFKINQDPLVTTQVTAVIQSNSGSLALVPQGVGALVANIPDGTSTGGNARGDYAVDLQMLRSNANEVAASQNSFIGGGWNNKITGGSYGAIVSGRGNTLNANSWYTFIGGGFSNSVTGDYSVVSGGQSNTASTNTHATVVGGQGNTASGQFSTVIGGQSNTASGTWSIAGGVGVVASNRSVALGFGVTAAGRYSVALGANSATTMNGQFSFSPGQISAQSDNQWTVLQPYKLDTLTTAGTTVLGVDGNPATGIISPTGNNRAWKVKVEWIATVSSISGTTTGITAGDMAYGEANFGFKKVGGTSYLGTFINDEGASDSAIMDTCSLAYSVGASQELALTFTGPTFSGGGSVTMRIVAKVSLVEVAY